MPTRWPAPGVALALLLVLFGVRLVHSAHQNAFTIDEPNYVGTGLYLWESGDYHYFRSLRFHPPLVHHLASLPLLLLGLPEGVTASPGMGPELVARWQPDPTVLRVASRLPFVAIALWGACLCFAWVREVAGAGAGLLAVFLYTFSPSMLAHGALVHSDITLAVLYLQTLYAFWRWLRRPTPLRLVLCGLSLGLAFLAKLTSILLIGILSLLFLLAIVRRRPASETLPAPGPDAVLARVVWAAGAGAAIGAIAIAVVWLGYGGSFASVANPNGPFPDLALPGWIQSFLFVDHVNTTGRPVYFLGEFSSEGWWYFFPVAFAVKEPIGLLVLTGAALVSLRSRRGRLGLYLAAPFAVYLWILIVWLDVPLGYRYGLPLLPLLFVFIASQLWPPGEGARRAVVFGACALLAVESLWIHPHYLAHFNALIGGPSNGHRILLDANIDWGQDVTTLAREIDTEGEPPLWLALSAAEDPVRYGLNARPLRDCKPVGGRLAIGVNVRMGLYNPNNPLAPPRPGCYDWLDPYEPVARPGYSILVYDLPEPAPR